MVANTLTSIEAMLIDACKADTWAGTRDRARTALFQLQTLMLEARDATGPFDKWFQFNHPSEQDRCLKWDVKAQSNRVKMLHAWLGAWGWLTDAYTRLNVERGMGNPALNAAPAAPAVAQAVRVCEISDIQCSRGCGVGDCKREREARYPVEQPAAARDERASEVDGTFACPICGRTTPHEHSAEEQIAHRNMRKKIPDWHEGTLMEILEKAGLRFQYRNEDVRSAVIAGIKWGFDRGAESAAPAAPAVAPHPDDEAVDVFACAMKAKMAAARDKGRAGWERIDPVELSIMLREHVEKGDPRDVANFCMMLWHHGARISDAALPMGKRAAPAPAEPKGEQHEGERCNACHGSGWVVRDPDIGTDQECFVCDGTGTVEPEQRAATLSDEQAHEMYMRAAKAIEGKPRADTGFKGWCGAFIQSLVAILAAHNGGKNAD
jgi:hypothetical protein